MTYEETIYKIKGKIGLQADCVLENDQERQVVWEALEKQIPKKPTDIKENEQFHCKIGRCSRCNDWVNDGMNVCDKCYQVIDWSE